MLSFPILGAKEAIVDDLERGDTFMKAEVRLEEGLGPDGAKSSMHQELYTRSLLSSQERHSC